MRKLLTDILNHTEAIQVTGFPEQKEITGITLNSGSAKKGSIFFAIKGYKTDGHKYIQDALSNGADVIVIDNPDALPDEIYKHFNAVKIVVRDSREALSAVSAAFYDYPSKKLKLIGITGTKGKSTIAFYIKHLLESFGEKCGLIGTIANYAGSKEYAAKLTTPEAPEINALMAEMVKEGCTYCVMEVSSHSLELQRVNDLDFDVAVFTNITSDHLDFHKDFTNYRNAKIRLFNLLKDDAVAVINFDDESGKVMAENAVCKVARLGSDVNYEYCLNGLEYDLSGTTFCVKHDDENFEIKTPLVGRFNQYNAGLAFSVLSELGFDNNKTREFIAAMPQVPGRFEVVSTGDKTVIVDYSHTSDSLKQALESIAHANVTDRPVFTVMGCGGDRDRSKRPVMGNIASEGSTHVIVTSDNPRTENPVAIIDEILTGIKKDNYVVIESREEAIKYAIEKSPADAVVLIAGKGHETYQEINGVRHHFSDKETARKYLKL